MGFLGSMARHLDALKFFLGGLDVLLGPVVMLLYPLCASMRAIERPSPLHNQQWLTYWVLYSLITLFELSCWRALQWFPPWPYMKLVFCFWLVLPVFNGAAYIYENYVRKYVKDRSDVSSSNQKEQSQMLQMSLDARKAVEQYIEKYGIQDFFPKLLEAALEEAKKR